MTERDDILERDIFIIKRGGDYGDGKDTRNIIKFIYETEI
jgi:hypothetical protein